jgi:hypothetical protein
MRREWFRSRWAAIILGLVVGAAAGLAVYQGSRLSGQGLFVLCGTTAGAVAAVVVRGYAGTVRLTGISVSIPQFSELRFAVTRDNKQVAWRLFVEAVTRVSVQPLGDGGLLREAMTSLYNLFATTREVVIQTEPSRRASGKPTVEHLAIAMLNNEIRPFLSRWHPRLGDWEAAHPGAPETEWVDAAECRSDLAAVQQRLLRYARGFGELAGLTDVEKMMGEAVE